MIDANSILPMTICIAGTIAVYLCCRALYFRARRPALHPVLPATFVVTGLIVAVGYPVQSYEQQTAPLTWLLGPAVVAMAVPVWERRMLVVANARLIATALAASVTLAIGSTALLTPLLGPQIAQSLALRSVTAPVAVSVAASVRLPLDLVTVAVMISGMTGMLAGPLLLSSIGVAGDRPATGAALGCCSHGLGTSRAFEQGSTSGAFASVCMGLSALAYGVVIPVLFRVL